MNRLTMAEPRVRTHLLYGDIKLIPVDTTEPGTYHNAPRNEWWHMPGGAVLWTCELIRRANLRGVRVRLFELFDDGQTYSNLN